MTAGSRVSVLLPGQEARVVKAAELSACRICCSASNSISGAIEVLPRAKNTVELNEGAAPELVCTWTSLHLD